MFLWVLRILRFLGRKKVLTPPDIKVCAEELGISVYQPDSLKNDETAELIESFAPDVIVVIAYGKILPQNILDIPKYGCVNIHGSVLPKLRGAAPIQRAVIEGEKVTGITAMKMDVGLDTGDIIDVVKTEIDQNETAGELFDRLSAMAPELLIHTLISLENGDAVFTQQDNDLSTYAKPLSKDEAEIDWRTNAEDIHNKVRGMNPWPVAFTYYKSKKLKVFQTCITNRKGKPGEIVSLEPPIVACGSGAVELVSVQLEGKKQMSAEEFFRGQRTKVGDMIVSYE